MTMIVCVPGNHVQLQQVQYSGSQPPSSPTLQIQDLHILCLSLFCILQCNKQQGLIISFQMNKPQSNA